jgi:hypothetical protein
MEILTKLSKVQGTLPLPQYNGGNPHICKIREVMMQCFQVDPTSRPTSTQLLAMLSEEVSQEVSQEVSIAKHHPTSPF